MQRQRKDYVLYAARLDVLFAAAMLGADNKMGLIHHYSTVQYSAVQYSTVPVCAAGVVELHPRAAPRRAPGHQGP